MEQVARLLIALLQRAQLQTLQRWGKRLGRLGYYLARSRRKTALSNLELAYGSQLSRAEKIEIAKQSFENLVTTALEFLYSPALSQDITEYIELVDIHNFWEAYHRGKGVIAIIPHMGNWEVIARFYPWVGVVAHAVARRQEPEWVARIVSEIRKSNGLKEIEKRNALRPVLAALRRGEVVNMLIDQYARKDSVEVQFFGHPARTVASAALIAARTGCTVFVCGATRTPEGRINATLSEIIETIDTGDREKDLLTNTQRYVEMIERFVRQYPGSWMWMHKRWKKLEGAVNRK
jgi:KDO2-lipid IV(A) lauroyltransferase